MKKTTRELSERERELGLLAANAVFAHGGSMSFDEYDQYMKNIVYFIPINWCAGWGDRQLWKANADKFCAFAACSMGLLLQTEQSYVTLMRDSQWGKGPVGFTITQMSVMRVF